MVKDEQISRGEWVVDNKYKKTCSECGAEAPYIASRTAIATTFYPVSSNFCPECGAKMKVGVRNEEND